MTAGGAGGPTADGAVARLVRWWVRAYTGGLPRAVREARRAEIECDLWEQQQADRRAGRSALETGFQVAARWLLGLPADLAWRRARGAASREARAAPPSGTPKPAPAAERPRLGPGALSRAALVAGVAGLLVIGHLQYAQRTETRPQGDLRVRSERPDRRPPEVPAAAPLLPERLAQLSGPAGTAPANTQSREGVGMNSKRLIYGTGAAVLVAGGLQAGVAFAQGVTPDQARAAALAHLGGGTVLEVELEDERGRTAYEVEVRRDGGQVVEVLVDAATGAVLATDTDDDNDDGPAGVGRERDDDD